MTNTTPNQYTQLAAGTVISYQTRAMPDERTATVERVGAMAALLDDGARVTANDYIRIIGYSSAASRPTAAQPKKTEESKTMKTTTDNDTQTKHCEFVMADGQPCGAEFVTSATGPDGLFRTNCDRHRANIRTCVNLRQRMTYYRRRGVDPLTVPVVVNDPLMQRDPDAVAATTPVVPARNKGEMRTKHCAFVMADGEVCGAEFAAGRLHGRRKYCDRHRTAAAEKLMKRIQYHRDFGHDPMTINSVVNDPLMQRLPDCIMPEGESPAARLRAKKVAERRAWDATRRDIKGAELAAARTEAIGSAKSLEQSRQDFEQAVDEFAAREKRRETKAEGEPDLVRQLRVRFGELLDDLADAEYARRKAEKVLEVLTDA